MREGAEVFLDRGSVRVRGRSPLQARGERRCRQLADAAQVEGAHLGVEALRVSYNFV